MISGIVKPSEDKPWEVHKDDEVNFPILNYKELDIHYVLKEYANSQNTNLNMVLAEVMKSVMSERSPLSQLLQYTVDFAGDQFVSEEFYQRNTELLLWLDACGCDNEEIRFRAYVYTHPDIFECKEPTCNGTIEGGCPKMICNRCARKYYLSVDNISDTMCSRCVADKLGECRYDKSNGTCTPEDRRRRRIIYAIDTRDRR
jgi:hypothetical protein